MPTILRFGAYRVMIYTHDHAPPHVHVLARNGVVIFYLHCEQQAVPVRERFRVNQSEVKKIAAFLTMNLDILCAAWERIHDDR